MEEKSEARTSSEGEILTLAAVLALGIGAGVARPCLGRGRRDSLALAYGIALCCFL